jgi:integrase
VYSGSSQERSVPTSKLKTTYGPPMNLTEKSVAALQPGPVRMHQWDSIRRGFGVIVGARGEGADDSSRVAKVFVARRRVAGKLCTVRIGVFGEPRDEHGAVWTVKAARDEADEIIGGMKKGLDPNEAKRSRRGGATLREALAFHLSKMERGENRRRKPCSPLSVRTLRDAIEKHFAAWLDRPLVTLDTNSIEAVLKKIEATSAKKVHDRRVRLEKVAREQRLDDGTVSRLVSSANPKNPPGRALCNRLIVGLGTVWRSWYKRHGVPVHKGLPVACPTDALQQAALAPRENRIAERDMPDWYARVMGLTNPVRRDLQLVALFTAIRSDGLRQLRYDDIDEENEVIKVRVAKGGRPYSVPLTKTVREIVERRRTENAKLVDEWRRMALRNGKQIAPNDGDGGWIFPSLDRRMTTVIPVAEVKERHFVAKRGKLVLDDTDDGEPLRERFLPGIHAARKTYNSVAEEIGIAKQAREALLNHAGQGVNERWYTFRENLDYLRMCAERIEAALWQRLKPDPSTTKRRGHLRSVPVEASR